MIEVTFQLKKYIEAIVNLCTATVRAFLMLTTPYAINMIYSFYREILLYHESLYWDILRK